MSEGSDRMKDFEARLSALKSRMEAGLTERAKTLRNYAARLENGDESARQEIKSQSHRLRGIAGTYGHTQLTDMAAQLEQRASLSPPPVVAELARELASAAERVSDSAQGQPRDDQRADPPRTNPSTPLPSTQARREQVASDRPAPKADGQPLRVLATDDDPITLRLLTLTLRQVGGFEATIVESAREALVLLEQQHFDVVLSDAMMPDMNGLEFCQAARALGGHRAHMPIIILSAATADELGWHRNLDAHTNWLRKPFRPTELVKEIARIVAGED